LWIWRWRKSRLGTTVAVFGAGAPNRQLVQPGLHVSGRGGVFRNSR
jgi:hypothetical protein